MGIESKINWCSSTWNPWHGCKKVSPGCKFCYMYRDKSRYGQDASIVLRSKTKFNDPLKWKEPQVIFTCSWSDFFIKDADKWRDEVWKIIKATPHHTYQILTKRPERIKQCLPADWGEGYDNVWLGVTVENNKTVERCEILGDIPAKLRFISAEPLIGEVDFTAIFSKYKFHWCIIGGESGNKTGKFLFRKCQPDWLKTIIHDCKKNKVKVWVKQLGTHLASINGMADRHGGNIIEWPKSLQVQEFPKIKKRKIK